LVLGIEGVVEFFWTIKILCPSAPRKREMRRQEYGFRKEMKAEFVAVRL